MLSFNFMKQPLPLFRRVEGEGISFKLTFVKNQGFKDSTPKAGQYMYVCVCIEDRFNLFYAMKNLISLPSVLEIDKILTNNEMYMTVFSLSCDYNDES